MQVSRVSFPSLASAHALRAMLMIVANSFLNVAADSHTLVVTPSMQTGFFEVGDDIGAMNAHAYRPNEFVTNDWVFEGLTAWDHTYPGVDGVRGTADDFVVGSLAASWTTNQAVVLAQPSAPYEITFRLRQGVKFHDGENWNAQAAALNFDHILGGSTKSFAGFHDWYGFPAALKEWAAVDENTFKLTFNYFYEPALRELTFIRPFRMMSPKVLPNISQGYISCGAWRQGTPRKTGDSKYTCNGVTAPIGTGPYKVVAKHLNTSTVPYTARVINATSFNSTCFNLNKCTYQANEYVSEVHFKKFEGHRSNPAYDTVIMRAYSNIAAIKAALLDGTLDIAYGHSVLTPSAVISLATDEGAAAGLVVHRSDVDLNTRLIAFNSAGKLDTPNLRKVVMKLIDRQSLYDGELGEEQPMDTLFDKDLPYCNVSLSSIVTLAAGTTNTTSDVAVKGALKFIYLKDVPHQAIIANQIIADLYEAGIQVAPMPVEKAAYNEAMDAWLGPDYDPSTADGTISFDLAYSETWGPSYDAYSKLYDAAYDYGSGEADAVVTSNLASLSKAQLNSLLVSISQTASDTIRQNLYAQALTTFHNEAIFLPLTAKRNIAVVNNRVSGFTFGTTEFSFPIEKLSPSTPLLPVVEKLSDGAIVGIRFVVPCVLAGVLAVYS